jgi:hypothetical protein
VSEEQSRKKSGHRPRCKGTTAAGRRCRNHAKDGSRLCGSHSGQSGRGSKLTDERIETFLKLIRAGSWMKVAAARADLGESTVHRWLSRGEQHEKQGGESEFREFRDRYARACADAELRLLAQIHRRIEAVDPRSASIRDILDFMARRYPDRWSSRGTNPPDEVPRRNEMRTAKSIGLDKLSVDELEQLLKLREKMGGDSDETLDLD